MSFLAVTLVALIASQAIGQKWGNNGGFGGFQKGVGSHNRAGVWGASSWRNGGGNQWVQQGNWGGNGWAFGGLGGGLARHGGGLGGHGGRGGGLGGLGGHGGGVGGHGGRGGGLGGLGGHGGGVGGHGGRGGGLGGHGGGVGGHGGFGRSVGGHGGGHRGGFGGGFGGGHRGGFGGQASYLWNNGTITCVFQDAAVATVTAAFTIRRNIQSMFGYGNQKQTNPLTATLQLNPLAAFAGGTFDVVFTQMGRDTPTCTSNGMGPVIKQNNHYSKWGNAWGSGWGTNGVAATVTLVAGTAQTITIDNGLPLKKFTQFAGRGLLLCADGALTTDATGQTICPDASILGCCPLRFDNQGAVLP